LIWVENTTPTSTIWTNTTTFTVKAITIADLPYGTFWLECADYDFGGGQMVPAANDMFAYTGNGYQQTGVDGSPYFPLLNVDYYNTPFNGTPGTYRGNHALNGSLPGNGMGIEQNVASTARPNGASVTVSRNIGWITPSVWGSYTRTLPNGIYVPLVVVGAPGAFGSGVSLVTAGAGTTNQTLLEVGKVQSATGTGGYGTYKMIQITNVDGALGAIYVNGAGGSNTITMRWNFGLPGNPNYQLNAGWMALQPVTNVPPVIAAVSPAKGATGVSTNGQLVFTVQTYDRPVNNGSIVLHFNGSVVTPTVSGPNSSGLMTISYTYSGLAYSSTNTYSLSLADTGSPAPVVTKATSGAFVVQPQPPIASFTYGPATGTTPLTVYFTNTTTAAGGIASVLWTFGDGATSTATNSVVSHTYTVAPSTNTVTLAVTDAFGGTGSLTITNAVTVGTVIPPSTPIGFYTGSQLILNWNQGLLLEATNVAGPWITNAAATSPYTNDMTMPMMFFKVKIYP
jgi:PKD repeat protein